MQKFWSFSFVRFEVCDLCAPGSAPLSTGAETTEAHFMSIYPRFETVSNAVAMEDGCLLEAAVWEYFGSGALDGLGEAKTLFLWPFFGVCEASLGGEI